MRPCSLAQVAELMGVSLGAHNRGLEYTKPIITQVVINSRDAQQGSLFFALPGEKTDGHQFVQDVLAKGGYAVVREDYPVQPGVIAVPDPRRALQDLAKEYLRSFDGPVVAVTGSNGKTTTKDFIAGVLSSRYRVCKTPGNFNNELGLPLTVLSLNEEHTALVLEMGMRGLGEIAYLTQIAPPDVAVITNVGPVHVEVLGTMENIAQAKGEILDGLKPHGVAVLNGDDPLVRQQGLRAPGRIYYYGQGENNELQAKNVRTLPGGKAEFLCCWRNEEHLVRLPVPGLHNVENALAALGAGLSLGVPLEEGIAELARVEVSQMRLEIIPGAQGVTIVNDVYNASPASMRAALKTVKDMETQGRRIAILGDMLELGFLSEKAHYEIGEYAAQCVDRLLCVGQWQDYLAEGALAGGFTQEQIRKWPSVAELMTGLWDYVNPGDLILVKASRGMALERVVEVLRRGREEQ